MKLNSTKFLRKHLQKISDIKRSEIVISWKIILYVLKCQTESLDLLKSLLLH